MEGDGSQRWFLYYILEIKMFNNTRDNLFTSPPGTSMRMGVQAFCEWNILFFKLI